MNSHISIIFENLVFLSNWDIRMPLLEVFPFFSFVKVIFIRKVLNKYFVLFFIHCIVCWKKNRFGITEIDSSHIPCRMNYQLENIQTHNNQKRRVMRSTPGVHSISSKSRYKVGRLPNTYPSAHPNLIRNGKKFIDSAISSDVYSIPNSCGVLFSMTGRY